MKNLFKSLMVSIMGGALAAMAFTVASCGKVDTPVPETPEIANGECVTYPTVVLGSLSEDFETALNSRFPQIVNSPEDARIAIVEADQLKANTDAILTVYENAGIIIIRNPKPSTLNEWFTSLNINRMMPEDAVDRDIFAFSKNKQYILDRAPEGWSANDNLNNFVTWVNKAFAQNIMAPGNIQGSSDTDIMKIAYGQEFSHEKSYTEKFQEYKVTLSNPDMINGSGKIVYNYNVYPIFVYADASSYAKGDTGADYYMVRATYTAVNGPMTINPNETDNKGKLIYNNFDEWKDNTSVYHNWINKHGGVYIRLCGFYMTQFSTEAELVKVISKDKYASANGVTFLTGKHPSPATTENQTTYSASTTWSGSASISGGPKWAVKDSTKQGRTGGDISFSLSGGFSYTTSETSTVSDINVQNNSSNSVAKYTFVTQNLPKYDAARMRTTNPPLLSVSSAIFNSSWIWSIPETVESDNTYAIKTTMNIEYGSCHWKTSGADFDENRHQVVKDDVAYETIIAPNRIPTGLLQIENIDDGQSISQIKICKASGGASVYAMSSKDGSIGSGKTFSYYLPVGDYTITYKRGKTASSAKEYKLAESSVHISFTDTTTLNSDFDFVEK